MVNFQDYQDKVNALQLRGSLIKAGQRQGAPSFSPQRSVADMVGLGGSRQSQKLVNLPVKADKKNYFAQDILGKNQAFTISGDTDLGSIIEFKNNEQSKFGVIKQTEGLAVNKDVIVQEVSQKQVEQAKEKDPKLKIMQAQTEDIKNLKDNIKNKERSRNTLLIIAFVLIWIGMIVYFRFFNRI